MLLLLVRNIFPACLNLYIISEFPSVNLIMIQTIHFNEITVGWFPRLGIHRLEQIIGYPCITSDTNKTVTSGKRSMKLRNR